MNGSGRTNTASETAAARKRLRFSATVPSLTRDLGPIQDICLPVPYRPM